jgi:transcriptional regulator with XRE-family HTH domain
MNENTPLRQARRARGMSLEAAAAIVGLDMSQLSRIERTGKTGRDTATRLAQHFGLTEEQVLYPERFLDPGM